MRGSRIQIAAYLAPNHIVITGPKYELDWFVLYLLWDDKYLSNMLWI